MLCSEYVKARSIPQCVTMLTIGSVDVLSDTVEVYLENEANGVIYLLTATTDGAGLVTLDLTDFELLSNSSYSVRVIKDGQAKDITIETETAKAVIFHVDLVNNVNASDYTLQVA